MEALGDRKSKLVARLRGLLIPPVGDPTRGWQGDASADGQALGVLTFADCSFRAMPVSHGTHNPPGYPQVLVDRLRRRGVSVRGRNVYVQRTDDLPATRKDLTGWYDLENDPEVVLVQTGSQCALRTVFGLEPSVQEFRDRISRRLGRRGFLAYRVFWPLLGRFTRTTLSAQDPEALARFAVLVRTVWPRARIVVMPPFMPTPNSPWSRAICDHVGAAVREVCAREGIEFVDPNPALERSEATAVRCTNGYNLSWAGHEFVADLLEPVLDSARTSR